MNNNEIYAAITQKIIATLETSGQWHKPFNQMAPVSLNGHVYQGINYLILSNDNYQSRVYGTFGQIRANGGQVRKGEKSTFIVFWKRLEKLNTNTGKQESKYMLRYYSIFNTEQADFDDQGQAKIDQINKKGQFDYQQRHTSADNIISGFINRPEIIFVKGDATPSYHPVADVIQMPVKESFDSLDDYFRIIFHEFGHATGHPKRLNRFEAFSNKFGDEPYSKEELVAELCSSFLATIAGISRSQRISTAYIRMWSQTLRDNEKWIIWAASRAEKAADYILGKVQVPDEEDQTQVPELADEVETF
jgi:antirestriction protein ArdC